MTVRSRFRTKVVTPRSDQRTTLHVFCLALFLAPSSAAITGCGGSSSETPMPLEPVPHRGAEQGPVKDVPAPSASEEKEDSDLDVETDDASEDDGSSKEDDSAGAASAAE